MAKAMTARGLRPMGKWAQPTPLLAFLAGPHSQAIARLWPAPHERFLALPAARRHAAAILLAREPSDLAEVAHAVEFARDGDLAARLTPEPQPGLMKALGKLGETHWSAAGYDRFLELFADPRANTVLRHMGDIRPEQLELIYTLPPHLREARIVENVPTRAAARDLALAFSLALRIHADQREADLAGRWIRAKRTAALFDMAQDSLHPATFGVPTPAPVLPSPFEAVTNAARLKAIALEFHNCLRDFSYELAHGRMAVYVWRALPNLAVALRWDPAGWRLAEAEAKANAEAPEEALREVVAAVEAAGVRTGPAVATVQRRLGAWGAGNGHNLPEIGDRWIDRLELGDLWD